LTRVWKSADAPVNAVHELVSSLPGVAAAEVQGDNVIATPSGSADPRPEIAAAVVAKGWKLVELRPLAVNLEDIFLELTRRAKPEAALLTTEAELS
jgi:hypothetical protein